MSIAQHGAQLVVADAEEHADALGSREGQVEARHPRAEHTAERLPAAGMLAGKHALQFLRFDRALEPERVCSRAQPPPGRLWAAEVVVLDARAHGLRAGHRFLRLLEVVLGLAGGEFSDREHGNGLHPLTR